MNAQPCQLFCLALGHDTRSTCVEPSRLWQSTAVCVRASSRLQSRPRRDNTPRHENCAGPDV
eukprot:1037596-Alexandrium_andersonii.AAC.1